MDLKEIFLKKVAGTGDLTFILIHNAGGDHHFFTHQIDTLVKFGDVILIDLPGHGASGITHENGLSDSSSIIAKICQHFSLEHVCLVGLNNGADVAIDTVFQYDLPIDSIILIDPPLFMNENFIAEINEFIHTLDGEDCDHFIRSIVDNLFIETDEATKAIALNAFLGADRRSLQGMFRSLIEWDKSSAKMLRSIQIPALFILTDEHHCAYNKLKQSSDNFTIGKVIGSKCWATLEVPEQINSMLKRFLTIKT